MKRFEHYQYISFDVFDTLIKRSVSLPSDLFRLMERRIDQGNGKTSDFAEKRMQANTICEKENGGRSATLAQIYDKLRKEFGSYADQLMELEIQMELNGCRPNTNVTELFKKCIAAGKTVVLISDMYLPAEIIERMLKKCGISGYKKLYVSCEAGAKKRDGKLFRVVLDELGIKPSQLLHIGDAWRSDIIRGARTGIRVCHVENDQKKICKTPKNLSESAALSYRTVSACIRNSSTGLKEYEKQGCAMFGPLLLGFTQWLKERLQQDGITEVFFLARDGYTLKRAFDCLAPRGFNTYYMYSSRRAFTVPLLWKASTLLDIFDLRHFSRNKRMTVRSFVDEIGLKPEQIFDRAARQRLDIDHIYTGQQFIDDPAVNAFFDSIKEDMKANSRQEYEALVAYLRSFKLHGQIAVVDVGHQGTIQHALMKLLTEAKMDVKVKGYYVDLRPTAPFICSGTIDAEGYLCGPGKNEEIFYEIDGFVGITETLFCEICGSTIRFVMQQGTGVPEFAESIYVGNEERLVDETSIIVDYQNGAQKLVEYVHDVYPNGLPEIGPEAAISRLARLGTKPTLREAKLWGNFRVSKAIDKGNHYLARPRNGWYYLCHREQLITDIVYSWGTGFLKRVFLLPMPYDAILRQAMDVYKKIHNKK